MPRKAARAVVEGLLPLAPEASPPHIPVADNEPGAVAALLKANRALRQARWPAPYDRTRHRGART